MTDDGTSFWAAFTPNGQAYLWRPDILWLNVISDGLIALAYFSIPVTLFIILKKRPDTPYRLAITMFSLFIFSCGVTHLLGIWTVWHGIYGIHGLSKGITAVISMAAAVLLVPLLPRIASLESPERLHALNLALQNEVSVQKRSAEKLAHTERNLRTFLQQAPDGILICRASGKMDYTNDMLNSMFGYGSEGLTGQYVNTLLPKRLHTKISATHNELFKTDGSLWGTPGAEFTGVRADGTEFPLEIRINVILTEEDGDVTLATVRDISSRKAKEQADRQELLKIAHVSRLSTIGQMAAGLAHELNQPLTAISNNLYTAMAMQAEDDNPDEQLVEMMTENYQSAQRAGQIIRSLRQLVRKDDGSKKLIDVNELVKNTVKLISPEARASSVIIRLSLQDGVPKVLLDEVQTQQVLVNLGRNAIEALSDSQSDKRQIIIRTALMDAEQGETGQNKPPTLLVSLSDNGPGLNEKMQANLFRPYFTSKDEGMGLGLSICRSIVEAQGGYLWYEESANGGATFNFTLPILEEKG